MWWDVFKILALLKLRQGYIDPLSKKNKTKKEKKGGGGQKHTFSYNLIVLASLSSISIKSFSVLREYHQVLQARLELTREAQVDLLVIPLPQFSACWNYRHTSPCLPLKPFYSEHVTSLVLKIQLLNI